MITTLNISASTTLGSFSTTRILCLVTTASGNITLTLESAAKNRGQEIIIKHATAGNTLTVSPQLGETVNGSSSYTSTTAGDVLTVVSDGSNYVTSVSSSSAASLGTVATYDDSGTDTAGNTAALFALNDVSGTQVLEFSNLSSSGNLESAEYMEVAASKYSEKTIYISSDFAQGSNHKSILETILVDATAINSSSWAVEGWSNASGVATGNFEIRGEFTNTTALISFTCNDDSTTSGQSAYVIYGQDTSYLSLTDARFVWRKGISSPEIMVLGATGVLDVLLDVKCRQLYADGDSAGIASTVSITNGNNADVTSTTAVIGGIGAAGPSTAAQNGWIKIYVGTAVRWIPIWA